MEWTWDPAKDAVNRRKHDVSLSIAEVGLRDRLALSEPDPHPDGDRWRTLCEIGGVVFFVVHTWPEEPEPGRIISVRQATRRERKAYEHGRT